MIRVKVEVVPVAVAVILAAEMDRGVAVSPAAEEVAGIPVEVDIAAEDIMARGNRALCSMTPSISVPTS